MGFVQNWKINLAGMGSLLASKPIFAAWHITYRCNFKCKFCSFWRQYDNDRHEFSVQDFQKGSRRLTKLGVRVVNLAGGEPFLRDDLPEIVSVFTKDHIVIINSNGYLIDGNKAEAIWKAGTDVVNISLDFYSKDKHDYYRKKGAYEGALNALETLNETRDKKTQRVAVQAILSTENLAEFENLVKLAEDMEIEFSFNPYRPGDHEADLSMKNVDLSFLYRLKQEYKSFKATKYALDRTIDFVLRGMSPDCGMGKYMMALDPYGNIGPCEALLKFNAGNILHDFSTKRVIKNLRIMNDENMCFTCLTRERTEVEPLYRIGGLEWWKNIFEVIKG